MHRELHFRNEMRIYAGLFSQDQGAILTNNCGDNRLLLYYSHLKNVQSLFLFLVNAAHFSSAFA